MKQSFDAWHLPGLNAAELKLATYELGDLIVRAPLLTPEQLQFVIAGIAHARTTLHTTAVTDIVAAIDAAASRIARDETARALLAGVTGYSRETVDEIIAHMTRDWSRDSLEALLVSEVGNPAVLDGAVPDETGRTRLAVGPRLAFHIFSGNVPGVAVTSVIRSLLVKAATLGKTASGEPVLPVLFARALAAVAPALADALALTYWPGGTEELEEIAVGAADTIIVYGGEETVREITARVRPPGRLVVHGPKLSLGLVGQGSGLEVARPIAAATAAYDQQGCVSPHVVYVETGGRVEPRALARAIADELARLAVTVPRRRVTAAEALAIRELRNSVEFRAIGGAACELFASDDTSYSVIYDEDVTLTASCLNRTLFVKPIENIEALHALLEPHRAVLQSVAVAGMAHESILRTAQLLADVGVTRITTFEQLPWPEMTWHHDGRGPLLELLTWQDFEV